MMSFKNYAVSALTHSIRGQVDIIKVSQQAGSTTVCWQNHYTMWEGRQDGTVYMDSHTHANTYTHTVKYTHQLNLGGGNDLSLLIYFITGIHSDASLTHTRTHTFCLRTQTVLHCLFMNSSVCCRQAGDENIYSVLQYGHVFSIINLLPNLPSVLLTHLVILYSRLITYSIIKLSTVHSYRLLYL